MRPEASPLVSANPTSHLLLQHLPLHRRTTLRRSRHLSPAARLSTPEPPWLITPPTAPRNPFEPRLPHLHSTTSVPFSIRFIQMMKKRRLALTNPKSPSDLGHAGNAVWSLACMLEQIQRSALSPGAEAAVARDTAISVVWVFQNVFSASPDLAAEVLIMASEFVVMSMERAVAMAEVEVEVRRPMKATSWKDIGILEGERVTDGDPCLDYERKKAMYEHMIVAEKANSMILSNYAQMLYEYDRDLDRASDYFKWSVSAEPVDGEARSRYATFLWKVRGDIEAAEEMFLEAIEVEPWNEYHHRNYAAFLMLTGAWDTCHSLGGHDDGQDQIKNLLSEL